jgi:Flp pilus assembly pilin Flp
MIDPRPSQTPGWRRLAARLRALSNVIANREGAAAVEFALIAPILIAIMAGLVTITEGVMVQQRATHINYAVGDLVAQQSTLSAGYVTNVFAIGKIIMVPMQASYVQRVTSVVVQPNGQATVSWSCGSSGFPGYSPGWVFSPPAGIVNTTIPGDSAIYSETIAYFNAPIVTSFMPVGFPFVDATWFKPRSGAVIAAPPAC